MNRSDYDSPSYDYRHEPIHDYIHAASVEGCPEGCPGPATLKRFSSETWGLTCGPLYACPNCGSIVHSYTTEGVGSGQPVTYCRHCKPQEKT